MSEVIKANEEFFLAEHIGSALAKLHHVDALTFRMSPALDEHGNLVKCPLTMSSICRNAAMIQDGTLYQFGYINQWLASSDRSPLTNLVLPHRKILNISSFTGVVTAFLQECRDRRSQAWDQRISSARHTNRGSLDQLKEAIEGIENYIGEARAELDKWQHHIDALERVAVELRADALRCRRQQDRALARTLLEKVYVNGASLQKQLCSASIIRCVIQSRLAQHKVASVHAAKRKGKLDGLLQVATEMGLEPLVKALLKNGGDANATRRNGATLLYTAARNGHEAVTKLLCTAGATKDKAKKGGATPLFIAAQKGHGAIVKLLCDAGAAKDQGCKDGATPLHVAALEGHSRVVRLLCDAGASKDSGCEDGSTALFIAAQEGHESVVKLLCNLGAANDRARPDGTAPLHIAALKGHMAVVRSLCDTGARYGGTCLSSFPCA